MKKRDKDINLFFKGKQISDEAIRLLNNDTTTDTEHLDRFVSGNPYAAETMERLTDTELIEQVRADADIQRRKASLTALKVRLLQQERTRRRRRIIYSASSVAAALIAISLLLFVNKSATDSTIVVENQIPKEKKISEPTLVLSSGDNVTLNGKEGHVGTLAQIADNKISYTATSTDTIQTPQYNTLIIPNRYTYSIQLEDGTEVMLNACSELRYPVKFSGDKREVFLKGEALFKVSKGERPFIVNTQEIAVQVYGTEFNVNTNKNGTTETVLLSGRVGVSVHNSLTEETFLKPNQLYALDKHTGKSRVEEVQAEKYIAWAQGMFMYEKDLLSNVIDGLSKWYDVEFEFKDPTLKTLSITLIFYKSATLREIIETIERMNVNIHFTKTERGYKISKVN